MVDDLYLEPSRKAQTIFLLVIIFAALLFAAINPIINYLTPSQSAPLNELETSARLLTLLALGSHILTFFILLLFGAHFGRRGYRALKQGSYPPSGTIVIWRTKIRTGRQAILDGYSSIALGVFWGALALFEVYKIWLLAKLWLFTL
jgi:hypothetical protein